MTSTLKLGVTLRNMGEMATPEILSEAAQMVVDLGFESVWITDHIAIPPDDAEGSGGTYMDTLTTLAWLAGQTRRIKLGSGVLIVPYRAALPTAKQIAAVQSLSQQRLLLGLGVGWMDAEFRALGVDRHKRGQITDEYLEFFGRCFSGDVVVANGQPFLFKPCPPKPPFLIGGRAPYALERAAKYGDGWLPMAQHPEQITDGIQQYRAMTRSAGRPDGEITVMPRLPAETIAAREMLQAYQELGVARVVCAMGYQNIAEFRGLLDQYRPLLNR